MNDQRIEWLTKRHARGELSGREMLELANLTNPPEPIGEKVAREKREREERAASQPLNEPGRYDHEIASLRERHGSGEKLTPAEMLRLGNALNDEKREADRATTSAILRAHQPPKVAPEKTSKVPPPAQSAVDIMAGGIGALAREERELARMLASAESDNQSPASVLHYTGKLRDVRRRIAEAARFIEPYSTL